MIVATVVAATGEVVTVNVPVVLPAATEAVAGTLAMDRLLLERLTTIPPAGAAWVSVTVAVDDVPPPTVAGLSVREATVGRGVIVRLAEAVPP